MMKRCQPMRWALHKLATGERWADPVVGKSKQGRDLVEGLAGHRLIAETREGFIGVYTSTLRSLMSNGYTVPTKATMERIQAAMP